MGTVKVTGMDRYGRCGWNGTGNVEKWRPAQAGRAAEYGDEKGVR